MRAKLVNENLNEAYKLGEHIFYTYEIAPYEKAWIGPDGILGHEGNFLSWSFINKMMKKYRK